MARWDDILTPRDKEVFALSGYGKRAAILAIDAFSYNMKVSVVEECVFDRGQASHKINLFDMAMKYADVIPLKEAIEYIRGLPDNLYPPAL
jgi:isochorismate hydrolase